MYYPVWLRRIAARIEAGTNGYLAQVGWIESRARFQAIGPDNDAIPWFTYPAVHLLQARVKPAWHVLEFGSGMGTIWWSKHTAKVLSLEHDPDWLTYISERCSATVIETSRTSFSKYAGPAMKCGRHDFVIVDGLFRAECLAAARELVSEGGVIVLDDAQRPEYRSAIIDLLKEGYRCLELHGPQPVSKHPGCTAIFYRNGNILGI